MDKQLINLTIFLLKEYITDFDDCLKSSHTLTQCTLKQSSGLNGKIYYCESTKKVPKCKQYLDEISSEEINI